MTKVARNHNIHAKIASEGYCCMYGFLSLCKARGQTPSTMMPFLGLSRLTFYYHDKKLKNGVYTCSGKSDCLKPIIEEIAGPPEDHEHGELRPSDSPVGGYENPDDPGESGDDSRAAEGFVEGSSAETRSGEKG